MDNLCLAHHGVKGMKWGVRRFRNPDGTLTQEGKLRYKQNEDGSFTKMTRKERKAARKAYNDAEVNRYLKGEDVRGLNRLRARARIDRTRSEFNDEFDRSDEGRKLRDRYEKARTEYIRYKGNYDALDNSNAGGIVLRDLMTPSLETMRDRANAAGREYAKSRGEYSGKRLIAEYGDVGFGHFLGDSMFASNRRDGESVADWYVRNEERNYGDVDSTVLSTYDYPTRRSPH